MSLLVPSLRSLSSTLDVSLRSFVTSRYLFSVSSSCSEISLSCRLCASSASFTTRRSTMPLQVSWILSASASASSLSSLTSSISSSRASFWMRSSDWTTCSIASLACSLSTSLWSLATSSSLPSSPALSPLLSTSSLSALLSLSCRLEASSCDAMTSASISLIAFSRPSFSCALLRFSSSTFSLAILRSRDSASLVCKSSLTCASAKPSWLSAALLLSSAFLISSSVRSSPSLSFLCASCFPSEIPSSSLKPSFCAERSFSICLNSPCPLATSKGLSTAALRTRPPNAPDRRALWSSSACLTSSAASEWALWPLPPPGMAERGRISTTATTEPL
mmetsp:Transcript_32919/g.83066  ORF Transcript_32919/g.83066 Transcript_32919/m.83066 type:complete len:334 (-) Transcript_32919:56-1057(-)